MNGLNWTYVAIAAALPPLLALPLAWPLWRRGQMILGNVAGTTAIFTIAVVLIFTEHAQLDLAIAACLEEGTVCWPNPSAFARYAIYAAIALAEIFLLFLGSLRVEERIRRRDYSREWQR